MGEGAYTVVGGREHLVVMFADLCDYTTISENTDPEDIGELREAMAALAGSVVERHGGTVVQVYGDGVLAIFGYPESHEDDPRRAVEAALELHKRVRETRLLPLGATELCLHTGIHCGLVFVRQGDPVRGRYELTGDVVNTAARLSAAAGRDEVLVSASVLAGIEGFYELDPTPLDVSLKGKKLRVPAYRLTRRSGAETRHEARSRRGLTGFVGRTELMGQLLALVHDAAVGHLTLSLLTGPAGIGKSRMLEELRARIGPESSVLRGTCESFGELVPLEPFRQVLRQALGLGAQTPDQLAEHVPSALAELGLDRPEQIAAVMALFAPTIPFPAPASKLDVVPLVHTISAIVGAFCRRKPTLLLLDDWQWSDDTSRMVLDRILEDHEQCSLSIVMAARELDIAQPQLTSARRFVLEPFDEEESAKVVLALRPHELQSSVTEAIHRRAGGNPLFIEELCRSLPRHALADVQALEQYGAPTTLHGAIKGRISVLPTLHKEVLHAAATIGMEFSRVHLTWLVEDETLPEVLGYLTRNDLIYPVDENTFRFKHGIGRDVVYDSILLAERRRMHSVLASRFMEGSPAEHLGAQAEVLAYHFRACGDHARAVHYAELAGDRAMLAGALDRARHQYGAALHGLGRLPEHEAVKRQWLLISTRWALACLYSPARAQVAVLEQATRWAEQLGESAAQGQAHYMLGWIQSVLGDSPAAMREYRAALDLAEQAGAERLVVQLWANLGQCYAAACEVELAVEFLDKALSHKRARVPGTGSLPQGFAYALACRAAIHGYAGSFGEAERDLAEALKLVRDSGHPVEGSVLALSAMIDLGRGRWQDCFDAARRGRMIAERGNSAYVFAISSSYEHYADYKLHGDPEAVRRLRLSVNYMVENDFGMFSSLSHAILGDALHDLGDMQGAELYATNALSRRRQLDPLGAALALRTLARIHYANDPPRAASLLREAHVCADAYGSVRERALTELVELELFSHDLHKNLDRAGRTLGNLEAMGMAEHAQRARSLTIAPAGPHDLSRPLESGATACSADAQST